MKWSALIILSITFFEIGYCGLPALPYTNIQLAQATKLTISHFKEEYHRLIYDNLNNKKKQLVCLYIFYRPKKNEYRTNLTNYDKKTYAFAPTYGDGSTDFHRQMISVFVFYYSNKLQSVLVDYGVKRMGCFDDYSDAAPSAKTMRGNGITNFILHVSQCITFN